MERRAVVWRTTEKCNKEYCTLSKMAWRTNWEASAVKDASYIMYNGHLRNHDCWQHTSNSTPTTPPTWKGQEKTNEERIKKPIKNRGKRNDIRLRTFYAAAYKKSKLVIMFTIITVRSATNGNLRRWHYEDEEQDAKALYAYFPYENDVYLLLGHTRLLRYYPVITIYSEYGEVVENAGRIGLRMRSRHMMIMYDSE